MTRSGTTAIITGGLGLLYSYLSYLTTTGSPYYIPITFMFLMILLSGIFELQEYYNKNLYLISITLILTAMWISIYVTGADKTIYYLITILITLFIILATIGIIKEWTKFQKALEPYEKALKLNPNDTTALNNKAVKLTHQNKQEHAMKIFDQILKTDPQDPAALHNKGALLDKKGEPTQAKKNT